MVYQATELSGDAGRLDGLTNICRIRSSFGKLITQAPCLFHSASVSAGDIRPSSFVEAGAGARAGAEGGLSGTGVDGFIGWGVGLSNCFGFWIYEGRGQKPFGSKYVSKCPVAFSVIIVRERPSFTSAPPLFDPGGFPF